MHLSRIATTLLCAVSVLALAACGGGSGSPTPTPTPPPPTPATLVAGTASGPGGGLDEFVSITLTPTAGGALAQFNATTNGTFSQAVTAGTYDVLATRPGYDDYTQTGFVVVAETSNALDLLMVAIAANTYISSAQCGVCHSGIHDTFTRTGHPYKLNKVEGGVAPSYPFTNIESMPSNLADDGLDIPAGLADPNGLATDNILGTPAGWPQITYVIGGFYWKARLLDASGHIVTGTAVQYNFADDTMTAYHNNESAKPYNCGNCHTTGWKHYDDTINPARQDGLAGMDGTFAAPGVHCEACHGAGSTHAQTKSDADITRIATPRTTADFDDGMFAYGKPITCGECHTRDGERDHPTFVSAAQNAGWTGGAGWPDMGGRIAAGGGLIKHHEQYDEVVGLDPDNVAGGSTRSENFRLAHGDCLTCHGTHTSTVYRGTTGDAPGVDSSNTACMACHSNYDPGLRTGGMQGLNCVDCHMPKLAKSAVATTLGNGTVVGDVSSHIWRIRLDSNTYDQFAAGGTFSYPHITGTWACNVCHGNSAFAITQGTIDSFVFHNNIP